jgi:predicted XRE-type DNA-binding protein
MSHMRADAASCRMSIGEDTQLKTKLARELCAIMDGWTQAEAASVMRLHQSELSRLRNGQLERFSVARLIRLVAARRYNIEVLLKPIPRPFAKPTVKPAVTVIRYDSHGRAII